MDNSERLHREPGSDGLYPPVPAADVMEDALRDNESVFFSLSALRQPRFGQTMKFWRLRCKLTMRAVAEQSGVPLNTWSRVEKGGDAMLSTVTQILAWAMSRGVADGLDENNF